MKIDKRKLNEAEDLAPVIEPIPDLPNEITITWRFSDDFEESQLVAATINGKPVEGLEDPDASLMDLAGFSCELDIDEERLGELIAEKNLSEDDEMNEAEKQKDLVGVVGECGVDKKGGLTELEKISLNGRTMYDPNKINRDHEDDEDDYEDASANRLGYGEEDLEERYFTKGRNLTESRVWGWVTGK